MPNRDPSVDEDPYLWLEQVAADEARAWVAARNAETVAALCDAQWDKDRQVVLDILNAPDRIPLIHQYGGLVYNFWQDAQHPKGLWRRTTLASYRSPQPAWEILIDLDALAHAEGEDWVWVGCASLPPEHRQGLVHLSRGGADAVVVREFDLVAKRFVDDGFSLPEAKGGADWLDANTLLVSSALGGADFQTLSGYARTVRRWRRDTPFAAAPVIFECERGDMGAWGGHAHSPTYPRTILMHQTDFFNSVMYVEDATGARRRLDIPTDAYPWLERDWLGLNLRTDWTVGENTYPAGALIVIGFAEFMRGGRDFTVLFEPSARRSLQSFQMARDVGGLSILDNVRSRIFLLRAADGAWHTAPLAEFPDLATLAIFRLSGDDPDWAAARDEADTFVVLSESSVTPPTLSLVRQDAPPELLKQAPARFASAGLAVTQHEAVSVDGERIPYFQIARSDLRYDGANATLLTGYGGYQIASLPHYNASLGKLWLERGGVYVIANIRGGGEFGPDWHKAGMRAGKKLAHDDFAAVARDLVARGVTAPSRLACLGGSNGGLLVGNMLSRYPELFGAIVCAVPLLDMRRYTQLTAGASWIGEYGDPDDAADWAFLREISAYHHIAPGRRYPPILLTTSARDDRVHPGHARKMAAKLAAYGARVYFHEPITGGHAGATDNAQLAFNTALNFAFLRHTIAPKI